MPIHRHVQLPLITVHRRLCISDPLPPPVAPGCCLHLRDPCGTGDGRTSVGAAGRMDAGVAGRTDATARALASSPNAASATRFTPPPPPWSRSLRNILYRKI
jgi:hypothetical protein